MNIKYRGLQKSDTSSSKSKYFVCYVPYYYADVTINCLSVQLCEVVKQGATSLSEGGAEPQVLVLHAARDAAAALRDLAAATAAASGKHVAHPDMQRLKHAAKVSPPPFAHLPNPTVWCDLADHYTGLPCLIQPVTSNCWI